MIPDELPLGQRRRITLLIRSREAGIDVTVPAGTQCALYQNERADDALLRYGGVVFAIAGADDANHQALREVLQRRRPSVSWVVGVLAEERTTRVLVDVAEYPEGLVTPEAMEFGVDDKIVADVGEAFLLRRAPMADVLLWLTDELLLPATGTDASYLVVSDLPSGRGQQRAAFRVFGRTGAADVREDAGGRLMLQRVLRGRHNRSGSDRGRTVLLSAPVALTDAATTKRFGGAMKESLDRLVAGGASYLEFWAEYNRIEERVLLRRARKFGWLSYSRRESLGAGRWRFFAPADEDLSSWTFRVQDEEQVELEAAQSLPPELTADAGDPLLESEYDAGEQRRDRRRSRAFMGRFSGASLQRRHIDVQGQSDEEEQVAPPERGMLFLSLVGAQRVIERRRAAERRIVRGEAPMGMRLRALLENVPVEEARVRREQGVTKTSRNALGGTETPRQADALDVALNTPDIALIQGPPGTGKTAVIAALQARIAELAEKRHTVSGRILLSSFQHDALEHAASRTEVFGLPAVKIGSRWGQEVQLDDRVRRWASERVEQISAELTAMVETPRMHVLREVRVLVSGYAINPGDPVETAHLLRRVASLVDPYIDAFSSDALREKARQLEHRKLAVANIDDEERRSLIERAIRGLRTDAVAFYDDGPVMARRAMLRLRESGLVRDGELQLLERASEWDSDAEPPFLGDMSVLRDRVLDAVADTSSSAIERALDASVLSALGGAVNTLEENIGRTPDGVADVLAEFVHDLRHDPHGVERMLREYTVVLAATCQQAASHRLAEAKGLFEGLASEDPAGSFTTAFETVIIDEAARANPLDLLIPMSLGERRIILVGDHRQLPHMLEPEVEQELDGSLHEEARAALRQSLFERLFVALRKREATDNVRRTVTLDTQFRMHPALGDFVSRTFYERHDAAAVIKAGKPAEDFHHDLPGVEGAVAAWIDVPLGRGSETRGPSRARAIEARVTAEWVKRFADHRPDFSIGIVSFYSAQVAAIWDALARSGVAQTADNGRFELLNQYRETRTPDGRRTERLRVGTVDAFQGKEFDVVFLSLTRSNDIVPSDERMRRRKYGFLMLENRLCVAMSRQQRLLVTVGDAAMVETPNAAEAIPALVAFRELCRGPQGRLLV